jgi:hypothetical protein
VQENLDHHEPRRLKGDSGALAEEAKELKVNFSVCCEDAAGGDQLKV